MREKLKFELELYKHQRELLELEKEELKPKDWIPMEWKDSIGILGSERKNKSGE